MPDISMCLRSACPDSEECYRYRAIPNPDSQSYFPGNSGGKEECRYFIQILPSDRLRDSNAL